MDISLKQCFVIVHDPDVALGFYRDVLGLTVTMDVSNEGLRWITLRPPSQPDVEIVLEEPYAGQSREDGDLLMTLLMKGALRGLILRTPDLDDAFEKIRASGAEVLQEPTSQPWGARDCAFRDPSGNLVRLAQA